VVMAIRKGVMERLMAAMHLTTLLLSPRDQHNRSN